LSVTLGVRVDHRRSLSQCEL